jgi:hypothetical protein
VATPGELCSKTAELLGFPPNTTLIAWRALREDGRVTTGGRGKSAAHCSPSDAANLLIATIGKLPLQSSLKSWERFAGLTRTRIREARRQYTTREVGVISALKQGRSFQEGLTALITAAMSGSLQELPNPPSIQVNFHGPLPNASIRLEGHISIWIFYDDAPKGSDLEPNQDGDLQQSVDISGKTILGLGEFIRRSGSSN